MRVVSVLPSATEIVCALGHGTDLVGRSAECDFPPEISQLPVVMRARTWDAERPSREIDERVQRVRGSGESLYELDLERLRELHPELLLTQDLCGVCSVTDREVEAACAATGIEPKIVSLSPRRLAEVWDSVETVGDALGDPAAGQLLAARLRDRARPEPEPMRRRVAVVEWLDPPILAGLWTTDMMQAAGGEPVGPPPGMPSLRTSWREIGARAPDLLVLSPCSFSVERSLRELSDARLASEVAAVRPSGGIYVADEAYFSRPGPRLAEGVELLRHLLGGSPGPQSIKVARFASPARGAAA
jgi:iron complex transport system substrate-binding protein